MLLKHGNTSDPHQRLEIQGAAQAVFPPQGPSRHGSFRGGAMTRNFGETIWRGMLAGAVTAGLAAPAALT